ncbi:interleukin-13 isoform X1 [Symphalangus syndactylus]|nr:interleukin-13 isoform X1 [Symphalangus syndactylus]
MVSGVTTWAYKSCHKTPRPQATQPMHPLLNPLLALGLMALLLTTVIALTCLGGFASPGPVPPSTALRELIEELVNITQNQKTPLCNSSMVWSINLTAGVYCAALESLINVSGCSAIEKTQRMLSGFCPHKVSAGQFSSLHVRDTKIEVAQFVKDLLLHLKKLFREGRFN